MGLVLDEERCGFKVMGIKRMKGEDSILLMAEKDQGGHCAKTVRTLTNIAND